MDQLWTAASNSPTLTGLLEALGMDYDSFRSDVQLGGHNGTEVGTDYITLNGLNEDLISGMENFAHELNNAINQEQTAQLAAQATAGTISEQDFATACGQIKMTGVLYQIMVALEIGASASYPPEMVSMVSSYQAGTITFSQLQIWAYGAYSNAMSIGGSQLPASQYYNQLYYKLYNPQ